MQNSVKVTSVGGKMKFVKTPYYFKEQSSDDLGVQSIGHLGAQRDATSVL